MNKKWHFSEEVFVHVALLVVVGAFLIINFGYPAKASFFPKVVLLPLLGGLVAGLIISARRPEGKPEDNVRGEFLLSLYWTLALVGLMYLGGLVVAMLVFPCLYMRYYCRESWQLTIAISVGLGITTYCYIYFLQIPPYNGIIIDGLMSTLG